MNFEKKIKELYEKRRYRPVGVFALYNSEKKFLIVQSAKAGNKWYFPQGGIKKNESLEDNGKRELNEELSINFDSDLINIVSLIYFDVAKHPDNRNEKDKRDFPEGKAYFYSVAEYVGDGNFVLDENELQDCKWADEEEAIKFFEIYNTTEKINVLKKGLKEAKKLIGSFK